MRILPSLALLSIFAFPQFSYANDDLNQKLIRAIDKNNVELTKSLLEQGADIYARYGSKGSALMMASLEDNIEILKFILEEYHDPDKLFYSNEFVTLANTTTNGKLEMLKLLHKHGFDINFATASGETLLMSALHKPEIMQYLIDNGVDINARDYTGKTALMYAAMIGNLNAAKLLLENGADANIANNFSQKPLKLAKSDKEPNQELIALLEKATTNEVIDEKTKALNEELRKAVKNKDYNAVKTAFAKGANPNLKLDDWQRPIVFDVVAGMKTLGDTGIFELFIENGVDVNIKNNMGNNILNDLPIGFKLKDKPEIAKYLAEKGVDFNTLNTDETHIIFRGLNPEFSKILDACLDNGTDINIQGYFGQTLLMEAAIGGNIDMVKFLLAKGADTQIRNYNGETALDLVNKEKNTEVIKKLLGG